MKRIRKTIISNLMVALIIVSMLFGIVRTASANEYEPDKKGSFTLTLQETVSETEKKNLPNVSLKLYKVGTAFKKDGTVQFALDDALASTNVVLGDLTTAEASVAAAKTLEKVIRDSSIVPEEAISDANGVIAYKDLEQGMYLLVQGDLDSNIEISPMLLSLPYMEDAYNWLYDVKAFPKLIVHKNDASITVTKRIYKFNDDLEMIPLVAEDAVFTVGLFLDEEGTVPYRSDYKKQIHVKGASSGTVIYEKVVEGTYYLFELKEDGTKIPLNEAVVDGSGNTISYTVTNEKEETTNQTEVQIPENANRVMYVNNCYFELPDGYFMNGKINITKNVIVDDEEATVEDTFYAGIFKDGELVQVVELKQNDVVTVEVPLDVKDNVPVATKYIVKETDKDGNPVDKEEFEYEVSGEGTVTLKEDDLDEDIEITNELIEEEEKEEEKSKSSKTGDETPIGFYMGLLLAAAIVMAVVFAKRRKSN